MLVERVEGAERARAQVALVRASVPCPLRRPHACNTRGRLVLNEARRIGEDAVAVEAHNELVDHPTRHSGGALARLEVGDERSAGDELPGAALHGALDGATLMNCGAFMCAEIEMAVKHSVARRTVHVAVFQGAVPVNVVIAPEELEVHGTDRFVRTLRRLAPRDDGGCTENEILTSSHILHQ